MRDESLKTRIGNLEFLNPVGLAAGFDKFITAPQAYSMFGFGFAELGSITCSPLSGNPKPRLWRIPDDEGLIVYHGLANGGSEHALNKMSVLGKHNIPLGISIAPTTGLELKDMSGDYLKTFLRLHSYADYITLNVSCPNVASCEKFAQVSFIKELAEKMRKLTKERGIKKDIFIKIGPEFNDDDLERIVECCVSNEITGIIAINLIKDRNIITPKSSVEKMNHPGGLSGGLLRKKSNEVIKKIYCLAGDKLKIIGLGGIFTAEDAYEKIKCGASIVQIITGWIYGGPFQAKKINLGLANLIKKDGYKNITEAVGSSSKIC